MATDLGEVKTRLWEAADQLRANSELQASEYSQPVLGLIFLRFAEERFAKAEVEIGSGSARNPTGPDAYKAKGVLFLPPEARYEHLLNQPEAADLGRVVNNAMSAIEDNNAELKGVNQLGRSVLRRLRVRIHVIDGHEVCRIDVPALSSPTWHDQGKDDPILWERLPHSTRKVPRGEVDEFLIDRFGVVDV